MIEKTTIANCSSGNASSDCGRKKHFVSNARLSLAGDIRLFAECGANNVAQVLNCITGANVSVGRLASLTLT
jgi:hypothetical protein